MQINIIKNTSLNFCADNNAKTFGYDDRISQERRDFLREDILERSMPNYNILENNGRLEKYELKKLISTLCGQKLNQDSLIDIFKQFYHPNQNIKIPLSKKENVVVDYEMIESLPLYNLDIVSKNLNVYRGESLNDNLHALQVLKSAGLERIIDLIGYKTLKDDCAIAGLEYFVFPMNPYSFNQKIMFKTEEENKLACYNICRRYGYTENERNNYIKQMMTDWEKNKNAEIDEFVSFIQEMKKGNLYIGCEYGTQTTDNALMLNAFFNPMYVRTKKYVTSYNIIYTKKLEKLYKNLTQEHKERMGWSKEFEAGLVENLKAIARYHR